MKIRLSEIPDEGLSLTGTFDRDILELDAADSIQPAGPVRYDILVELDKDILLLSGSLEAPLRLRCVKCLDDFSYTLKINDYQSEFDISEDLDGAPVIDLRIPLREDLLLATPSYPHCDDADDPDRVCPKAGKLAFESPASAAAASDDESEGGAPPSQWSALDQLGELGGDSDR